MKLFKYTEFLTESNLYDLILESKLVFSSSFINILKKIKDDKVAGMLLYLYSKDIDGINHNYIDVSDSKDRVTFTQDRKAQELIKKEPQTWKVIDSQRYLTHSEKNNKIFSLLGYEKPTEGGPWIPNTGILGLILNEVISPVSGKVYVVFEEYGVESPRKTVLNKQALASSRADNKVWSHARNPVNVGKLARAILKASSKNIKHLSFNDKDIENFVNLYKSTYDFMKDATKRFDIVQGKFIAKWYYYANYEDGGGTLNNSCMSEVDEDYFDIYVYNKQVSLIILYDDKGTIDSSGKYISDKIKGRALLWDCELDGSKVKFMDRIYTTHDSDVELFKTFAQENDWWYKKNQTMSPGEELTNGKTSKYGTLNCDLRDVDYDYYPYIDTLCYNEDGTSILSNKEIGEGREFRDTDGEYTNYYEDDYDD